jgi:hypothetical protein
LIFAFATAVPGVVFAMFAAPLVVIVIENAD